MANFWEDIGKTLFGDSAKMSDLQAQIAEKERQIRETTDNRLRSMLTTELDAMKNKLAENMQAQGATDEQGRLLAAKDVQDQFVDQDYLNLRKMQQKETESQQLAQALRAGKQMQLQSSQRNISPFEIAGQMEAIQRRGQEGLAQDVRGETLRAKGEAGGELARKQQYAIQLTDFERQNLQERIRGTADMLQLDMNSKAALEKQLEEMPDGLLVDLGKQVAANGIQALKGFLATGGNPLGMLAGAASDVYNNVSSSIQNAGYAENQSKYGRGGM